jgi:hypothetical protein
MWVRPIPTCLFIGILMPAMRAILLPLLALPLLVASVGTNHVDHAATAHDLAVLAYFLY